jgi:hypothetical protein
VLDVSQVSLEGTCKLVLCDEEEDVVEEVGEEVEDDEVSEDEVDETAAVEEISEEDVEVEVGKVEVLVDGRVVLVVLT